MPKFALERHAYAPELNKVHLLRTGKTLPAPGCRTIEQARQEVFPEPEPRIVAKIEVRYPENYAWLNRTFAGRVASRAQALDFYRAERKRLSVEHGGTITLKTYLKD